MLILNCPARRIVHSNGNATNAHMPAGAALSELAHFEHTYYKLFTLLSSPNISTHIDLFTDWGSVWVITTNQARLERADTRPRDTRGDVRLMCRGQGD